ncbi:MAG: AzlD domain-containing protein [Actinomycetota bacterium]
MTLWWAVLVGAAGCYALKLAGMSLPRRVLDDARVHRVGELLPVALLSALIAVQTFGRGEAVAVDGPRLVAVAAAVLAVRLRAPFLLVVGVAAATAALLRLWL